MAKSNRTHAGDQESLRQVNLSAVLTCLRQNAPLARAALADMTGLNKATITRLVREMIAHGFVRETGLQSSVTGRPSILLEMDPEAGYIIGARLDVDYSTVILTNFAAEILWRREETHTPKDDQSLIQDNLLKLIQEAVQQAPANGRPILGLGLSMPGLVDVASGSLLFAPNLGWRNVPVKSWLAEAFTFPVYVDNEANLAALGESFFGAARHCDYVLYINITAGVGAGIVLNQRILPGTSGLAGEVGHMTINPEGPRCNCGNYGCWEIYISAQSVFNRVQAAIQAGQPSDLAAVVQRDFDRSAVPLVVAAAAKGDLAARGALDETSRYIGIGIASLINTLNPKRVVLGGYLSPAYPYMLPKIQSVVHDRALRWPREAAEIVIAQYGSDASLMGAIATIYDHVLTFPTEAFAQSRGAARQERR